MSNHQLHIMQVLWDNATNIASSVAGWILALFGASPNFSLDLGDISVDGLLRKAALVLACAVSVATLYKIRKEIKALSKKDE